MKASSEFYDYRVSSVSSEDPDYLSSNLKLFDSSTESYRSVGTTETDIVLDLGQQVSNPHLILYNVNFTNFRVQGNFTTTWTSPEYDSGFLTVERDIELGIYKHKLQLTGFNSNFLRILIPAQTPINSESYFEVGVLGLFETLEDFDVYAGGFGLPVNSQLVQSEITNRFETNRKEVIQLSDIPVLEFSITGTMENSLVNRNKVIDVLGNPERSIFLFDRTSENSWEVYLVQRTGGLSISEMVNSNRGIKRYSISFETIL